MSVERDAQGGAPAVDRALRILEYLAHDQSEASLSDIATALDLNKSTCFNILKSLQRFGVVTRDSRFPLYRLGPKLVELGTATRRNYSYRSVVKRELDPLVAKFGVTCLLAQLLPNDSGIVVTDRIMPRREGAFAAPIGQVYPLAVPAMGRAVFAARLFAGVVDLIDVMPVADGEKPSQLSEGLEEVHARGFATSLEEWQQGVHSVATTVLGPDGDIALILCLMGRVQDFPTDRVFAAGKELHHKAKQLELTLQELSPAYALQNDAARPLGAFGT